MSIHDEMDPEDRLAALRERRREIDVRMERWEGFRNELIGAIVEVLREHGMGCCGIRLDILPAVDGGAERVGVELSVREGGGVNQTINKTETNQ